MHTSSADAVPGPSPSSPSPSPSTSDLEYIGCYKDKAEPDRLFDHVKTDKSMTPEVRLPWFKTMADMFLLV